MTASVSNGRREFVYQRPKLYPKQEAALFDPARYSIIEASTKSGKTVGGLAWITERAMACRPGQSVWWVAPVYSQASIAYRRLKRGLPASVRTTNDSALTVTLANEVSISFRSADNPDTLYGEDVYAVVIDEATRVKEEAWHAVRSTLTATRGPVRIIGNVKGRRNWAYRMARRAESGTPDMAFHKITAWDAVEAGVLASDEVLDAQDQLPERVFRELYLAEPSDDEGNPFGIQAIAACVAPLSVGAPAVWGWDLAKARDWTVGIGLDSSGAVCRLERFRANWHETIGRVLDLTGSVPALVDSTGVGDPVLEALRLRAGNFEGYAFTAPSKQHLMETLALAIQRQEVHFPDGVLRAELEAFEYSYTRTGGVRYEAGEGMHDDTVCGLALAVKHLAGFRASGVMYLAASQVRVPPMWSSSRRLEDHWSMGDVRGARLPRIAGRPTQ